MLAAEALRLAAIEVLLPTAAALAGGPYPTLAGARVYDSRAVALEDLDQSAPYTPVLSLYTPESGVKLRGPHAAADDTDADAMLDIIAELSTNATEDGMTFVDAMPSDGTAASDADARLVLAALCAQVRRLLERSQDGFFWRRLVIQILNIEVKTFAVPELGLRWHRMTIRVHCKIRDDDFDMPAGGLPEPIKSLYDALPDQSYAKEKLAALAAHFAPETLKKLQQISVTTPGPVVSGPKNLSP